MLVDWIAAFAVVASPLFALWLSRDLEDRRQKRDAKFQVIRMVVSTRHIPADPSYNTGINLIPIEFRDISDVMEAHKTYIDIANRKVFTPEEVSKKDSDLLSQQTQLIVDMLNSVGMKVKNSDIQINPYLSEGFGNRDKNLQEAILSITQSRKDLRALLEIYYDLNKEKLSNSGGNQSKQD